MCRDDRDKGIFKKAGIVQTCGSGRREQHRGTREEEPKRGTRRWQIDENSTEKEAHPRASRRVTGSLRVQQNARIHWLYIGNIRLRA